VTKLVLANVCCLLLQDLHLPTVFNSMEANKEQLGIVEYSLTQTTLEDVFVSLAQPGPSSA
jgi:hypothetical protein